MEKSKRKLPPAGFEPATTGLGNTCPTIVSPEIAIVSGDNDSRPTLALHQNPEYDAELGRVLNAWPSLSADAKAAILAVIDAARK
jgi:hypothetical protein